NTIYKKHQSFDGIRHQRFLPNILERIRALQDNVLSLNLNDYRKDVIERACRDILSDSEVTDNHPAFSLHSNVVEEISRISDKDLPRYIFYRYRYEIYPQLFELDEFPPCLQIEPTSACNYRCVFCYQIDKEFTKKSNGHIGIMSLETFKRLIDQAEGHCEAVTLASRGEPFLNPYIKEMLRYISGKFLALKMNTNASLLDEEKCHAILESGVKTLVFSADAASEPTYGQLRVRGRLDRVLERIKMFSDIRAKHYPSSPIITRVSGVKVDATPNIEEMEKFWGELVDQVAFVNYNPWESTYERPINQITAPCSELWLRMFVWWDGTVNPCENDYRSSLAVGNCSKLNLSQLWRSEPYEFLREQHLSKKRSTCSPCRQCPVV
ncbi:MAG: radical SAM protein, partial [Verrucomicrobiota bacterium]|nr:radical SAM protein [Verrucomicrobiota bacterium]